MMERLGFGNLGLNLFNKNDRIDAQNALAKSTPLANQLAENRWRHPNSMSLSNTQARFMAMSGQKPTKETFDLYVKLIEEELQELKAAIAAEDDVEIFDALCDLHVVVAGAGVAKRFPMSAGLAEVFESNFSKFDSEGKPWAVREDGKILKDHHFKEPDLLKVLLKGDQP